LNQIKKLALGLIAMLVITACSSLSSSGAMSSYTNTREGVLAASYNLTLYIFAKDTA
jgi:predicted lipoprotein with Yx(FWY)xxD motif